MIDYRNAFSKALSVVAAVLTPPYIDKHPAVRGRDILRDIYENPGKPANYEESMEAIHGANAARTDFFKSFEIRQGQNIVEIGPGTGVVSFEHYSRYSVKLTAFERSTTMINQARYNANKLGLEACFYQEDVESLALEKDGLLSSVLQDCDAIFLYSLSAMYHNKEVFNYVVSSLATGKRVGVLDFKKRSARYTNGVAEINLTEIMNSCVQSGLIELVYSSEFSRHRIRRLPQVIYIAKKIS